MMSGVAGEVTEVDELLKMMKEAREEVLMQRNEEHDALRYRDQHRLEAASRVLSNAMASGAMVLSDAEMQRTETFTRKSQLGRVGDPVEI